MHCPNCGAQNKKKQNYCRYCGLHLPDIERLYLSQLVFGEDTKQLKKMRSARKLIDYVQIFLVVILIFGIFRLLTTDQDGGRDLVKFGFVSFMIMLGINQIIGYFHRLALKSNRRDVITNTEPEKTFETQDTARLIEEKPFSPVAQVTENSTELLFVENKTK